MIKYFWDFFGPMGQGTAEHFHRHLDEFIAKMALEGCETGVDRYAETHSAAWCCAPESAAAVLKERLRPRREATEDENAVD